MEIIVDLYDLQQILKEHIRDLTAVQEGWSQRLVASVDKMAANNAKVQQSQVGNNTSYSGNSKTNIDNYSSMISEMTGAMSVVTEHSKMLDAVISTTGASVSNGLGSMGSKLGKAAPIVGAFAVGVELSTAALKEFTKFIIQNNEHYMKFQQQGFQSQEGIVGLYTTAAKARISIEDFSDVIRENNQLFSTISTNGIVQFAEQIDRLRKTNDIINLGYTARQTSQFLADYYDQQRRIGTLNFQQSIMEDEAARRYIDHINKLSNATGIAAEDLSTLFKDQSKLSMYAVAAKEAEQQFGKEVGQQQVQAAATVTETLGINPSDFYAMLSQGVYKGDIADLAGISANFNDMMVDMRESYQSGTFDAETLSKITEKHLEGVLGDINSSTALAYQDKADQIMAVISGMQQINDKTKEEMDAYGLLLRDFNTVVGNISSGFNKTWGNFLVDITSDESNIFDSFVKNFFSNEDSFWGLLKGELGKSKLTRWVSDLMGNVESLFTQPLSQTMGSVIDYVYTQLSDIDVKIGDLSEYVLTKMSELQQYLYSQVANFLNRIPEVLKSIDFSKAGESFFNTISNVIQFIADGMVSTVKNAFASGSSVDWVGVITSIGTSIFDFYAGFAKSAMSAFGIDTMISEISEWYDSTLESIKQGFDNLVEMIFSPIRYLGDVISDMVGGLINRLSELPLIGERIKEKLGIDKINLPDINPEKIITTAINAISNNLKPDLAKESVSPVPQRIILPEPDNEPQILAAKQQEIANKDILALLTKLNEVSKQDTAESMKQQRALLEEIKRLTDVNIAQGKLLKEQTRNTRNNGGITPTMGM